MRLKVLTLNVAHGARFAVPLHLDPSSAAEGEPTYPVPHARQRVDQVLSSHALRFTRYALVPDAISDPHAAVAERVSADDCSTEHGDELPALREQRAVLRPEELGLLRVALRGLT